MARTNRMREHQQVAAYAVPPQFNGPALYLPSAKEVVSKAVTAHAPGSRVCWLLRAVRVGFQTLIRILPGQLLADRVGRPRLQGVTSWPSVRQRGTATESSATCALTNRFVSRSTLVVGSGNIVGCVTTTGASLITTHLRYCGYGLWNKCGPVHIPRT